ncbi:oligosaccharyl transferase alpha subunit [Macrolepiota fuliginosa MF-IS2]|uniref:Dolichyl-diphosphooligosaccharide--protein glycosyltransferase subunit 1 n=1 Tax=Macrolepiota fuliginosa MF-IS2 TaxID=1400762 RepID=A0A9P6C823_9AGAR|nr:oligosaccharyl transferase alpha subunit [Macrolepiota fuliginosa MF-IS2]
MPLRWRTLPHLLLLTLFSVATSCSAKEAAFENTAVVRTADLGGAIVHVMTTYAIKSLANGQDVYTVAFTKKERDSTSFLEVKVKGQKDPLEIRERPFYANAKFTHVDVLLPKKLAENATLNLVVETIQTHMTEPWPEYAGQKENQAMRYTSDLYVLSPYPTLVQRTKIKALAPRIISFTNPENVGAFASDSVASKSGATVTYGPFNNLPATADYDFIKSHQQPVTVRYYHDQPVLEVTSYKRAVEISHWGSNINTEDNIILHNAGPKLKGHFSRVDYQQQTYYGHPVPHILHSLRLDLPPGINNVYYYDLVGNVSTSRLNIAPAVPKGQVAKQDSNLELKPRYPLMGGWNYTFTLGWDADLASAASYNKSSGEYQIEVPIMTPISGAVVDNLELKVVLPEGATDIEVVTPYPSRAMWLERQTTYLDTIGRPVIMFEYKDLTMRHAQKIYVVYKLSVKEHFRKPFVVSAVFFGLFLFTFIVRRIDLTIHKKRKTA